MKLTNLSVDRPITAMMFFVGVVVLGFVSYSKMALDLFPDIEFPVAAVILEYPGVGPKEIESAVSRPIEETLASINNIENITSVSKEGSAMVIVKYVWGTDMSLAVSDMREKIDIVKKFLPEDIETPVVMKFDMSMMPILMLSLSGKNKTSAELREYAEDELKSMIERVDGVASAGVMGGEKTEVKVELIKNRMDAYGITIDSVINILRMENLNVAGGEIKSYYKQFTLRTMGEFKSLNDIRNVVVAVKNNTPVYLSDIAAVFEAPAEKVEIVRLNGEYGVMLRISKQSDKNTVITVRNIYKELEEIKKTLPAGVTITPIFDQAEHIEISIGNVTNNAIVGGFIAVFIVFLFLKNLRSALILGLSIPISIIATFIVMYYSDITLNMMSMGGLALGVGMLIDNSIVILENIFRFREKGARPTEAAKLGADEMAMAITASTLTTICVFVPFLFTEGLAGQLFRQMALTISFSLLCSLVIALTLIPMLSSQFIKKLQIEHRGRTAFINRILGLSDSVLEKLEHVYSVSIQWALNNRKKTVLITAAAIVFGIMLIPLAGIEFMPEQDQARIVIQADLPVGTNLDTTEGVLKMCEKRILGVLKKDEYRVASVRAGYGEGFAAAFGGTTDHSGRIEIQLVLRSQRDRSESEIRDAIRIALRDVPGVKFNFSVQDAGAAMMGIGGAQISIEVFGHDFEQSEKFTGEIEAAIKNVQGLKDIDISTERGLPEYVIKINRDKASKMGLSAYYISNLIKDNVAGKVATQYRKKGKEYDIFVRLREKDRKSLDDIKNIQVNTPMGISAPLGNIIEIELSSGPATIERKRQERVTYIYCKAEGRDLYSVVSDIKGRIGTLVKPQNFQVNIAGAYEDMQEGFVSLAAALVLAVVLIYIIMASQFESFSSPFIIMFSVPTIIFGVMLFLFLTGTTFNVISFMGVLMLSGIVVNNAIVLVDYTNILRARGYNLRDALVEAGRKRLRPIMMTTFTTIFGLIPMALGLAEGSEMNMPLARSVMGGLSSSFIFTLLFIPVIYSYFETFKEKIDKRFKKSVTGVR